MPVVTVGDVSNTTTAAPAASADAARPHRDSTTDLVCAGVAVVVVALAFAIPQWRGRHYLDLLWAASAPLFGYWHPHVGWGTGPAIALAALVVIYGPGIAERLAWPRLLLVAWLTAVVWTFALAMIDGWQEGFAGRLTRQHEYLWDVGGVHDIGAMLRGFAERIPDFQPNSWTTHVSGHPPGALLTFVLLDHVGLHGGAWAAWLCVLAGCSAVVAVAVTVDALNDRAAARAALPFLALAPAAIWIGVSADGFFAGVTSWAMALLALATGNRSRWQLWAVASGLLFGFGCYLNYGAVLMALPAAAVLAARGFRPALPALAGVAVVVAAFTLAGFWWPNGYHQVVVRYYQGIGATRPFSYWVWGNIAATLCAVGPAAAAAAVRVARKLALPQLATRKLPLPLRHWRSQVSPVAVLAAAAVLAILAADLSGLSKAETERIWLPFDVWLIAAAGLLPKARYWLAAQALTALLINHLLMTSW